MRGEVTMHIAATPQNLWELVSDVTNTGRFSPETFEAEWLGGATSPGVGVRFRGHVRRNGKKWLVNWTTCTITMSDPGRDFAFQVDGPGGKATVKWGYHFDPKGGGTDVTESFEMGDARGIALYARFAEKSRTQTNLRNMRMTLERVRAVAESPSQS